MKLYYEWTVKLYSGAADWTMTFTPSTAFDPERAARDLYESHPASIKELSRRRVMRRRPPEPIAWTNMLTNGDRQ